MSRIRGRLNRLERHAGPHGTCPVCRGDPPTGTVLVEESPNGRTESGTRPCSGCGKRGGTLWVIVEPRPVPKQ